MSEAQSSVRQGSFDALVVGGGAIGLSIAWRAARAGLRVAVVDPAPGRGASWAAAGMLAPVTEVHPGEEGLLRLNIASRSMYPGFVQDLELDSGLATGYRESGTVLVARDNDDLAALSDVLALQQRLGLEARKLRSAELRALEPALVSSVRGGIEITGDHQIDNRALIRALLRACEDRGVAVVVDRVTSVEIEAGRAVGVMTASGAPLRSSQVVLAAGARIGELIQLPELRVRPVKGQLLHLRATEPIPLNRTIRGLEVYLVPRPDGRLVVGATVEEQGFDESATAGAVRELLDRAYELVPGISEMELVEIAVGHRPATPDNAPLLGWTSVEGLLAATGHYRNGILLTPVTADTVVAMLTDSPPPADVSAFDPRRFASLEHVS